MVRSGTQTCGGVQLCLPLWENRNSGHVCWLLFGVWLKVQVVRLWLDQSCVCVSAGERKIVLLGQIQ